MALGYAGIDLGLGSFDVELDQIERVERMLDDEVVDVGACFWLQTLWGCAGAICPMYDAFSAVFRVRVRGLKGPASYDTVGRRFQKFRARSGPVRL